MTALLFLSYNKIKCEEISAKYDASYARSFVSRDSDASLFLICLNCYKINTVKVIGM